MGNLPLTKLVVIYFVAAMTIGVCAVAFLWMFVTSEVTGSFVVDSGPVVKATKATGSFVVDSGPVVKATKGELWPKPKDQSTERDNYVIDNAAFGFEITGETCEILDHAIQRYKKLVLSATRSKNTAAINEVNSNDDPQLKGSLRTVNIHLTSPCEDLPYLEMDESYKIMINETGATISADSIWGILRGFESFSQLVIPFDESLLIHFTTIKDHPRFRHRGLLVDTSRHFISMDMLIKILDGMAYNKLNVFHWHIVDDQSFPYVSKRFPELSEKGAYHSSMVYSPEDVQRVIEEARLRGIRVMSEFDTPGHTRSWGESHPELLTPCFGKLGPMDPTKDMTYTFLTDLFREVSEVFPDRYVHLGGDEVAFDCWQNNTDIWDFMTSNGILSYGLLQNQFTRKIVDIVSPMNRSSLVWQEVYENAESLPEGTVVHVWTGNHRRLLDRITRDRLPALLSACWYLDHLAWGGDWHKYYNCDPLDFPGTEEQKKLVLGGEACMWSEVVNDHNILQRIFPRVSAAAEKLWSHQELSANEAAPRLEEHACRMNYRGIPAQPPNGPGFCL